MGSGTFAARGVPARFLDPSKPSEKDKTDGTPGGSVGEGKEVKEEGVKGPEQAEVKAEVAAPVAASVTSFPAPGGSDEGRIRY